MLGSTVLVYYGNNTLVIYRGGSSTPGQVLLAPTKLQKVSSITTDGHSNFTVTEKASGSYDAYSVDRRGRLHHRIQPYNHGKKHRLWLSGLCCGHPIIAKLYENIDNCGVNTASYSPWKSFKKSQSLKENPYVGHVSY